MKCTNAIIISLSILLFSTPAFGIDTDGNGIDDSDEVGFIEKFMPCIQLDSDDEDVSPKPVEIIGAESHDNLYVTLKNILEQNVGTFLHSELSISIFDDDEIHLLDSFDPAYRLFDGPDDLPYHYYFVYPHWEWGSTTSHTPSSWRSTYNTLKDNYDDTVYVTLWESGDEICIQYFLFYPYNDWINNHEGDWERICVVVDDEDPDEAKIKRIEYGFHHKMLTFNFPSDLNKCFILDDSHPVIFAGGHGNGNYGGEDYGPTGHGCFPMPGTWAAVDVLGNSETMENHGNGKFIHYNDFLLSYEILKTPDNYNFTTTDIDMAWFGSKMMFGHLNVPSPGYDIDQIFNIEVGNTPPRSPLYNWTWHLTGPAVTSHEKISWYTSSLPHSTAIESGWGLHVPGHYANLQDALNDASSGMTVFVDDDYTLTSNATMPSDVILIVGGHLTIPYGKTLTLDNNATIKMATNKYIEVDGTLVFNDGSTLQHVDGEESEDHWGYLDINSTGSLTIGDEVTIENSVGVWIFGNATFPTGDDVCTISNNSAYGVFTSNCSPTIRNTVFINNNYSGVVSGGNTSAPIVEYITVTGSDFGAHLKYGSDMHIDDSNIQNVEYSCVYVEEDSYAWIDCGYNDFYHGDAFGVAYEEPVFFATETIYWGEYDPNPYDLFIYPGSVDWGQLSRYPHYAGAPGATDPPPTPKIATQQIAKKPLRIARELEKNGDWHGAIEKYNDIIETDDDLYARRFSIKRILQLNKDNNLDYDDIRETISKQLKTAKSVYKASLDFLLCETYVCEGNIDEAIFAFNKNASKYSGTSMEVESLCRLAVIHADYKRDKAKALEMANKAKAINPGQGILTSAFHSVNEKYDPSLYTDKFKGVKEDFDNLPGEKEKSAEKAGIDFFAPSPNPFNPSTTLSYSLANPGHVTLHVYNSTGQKVATLVDSYMSAGNHSVVFNGNGLASGMYFYLFESEGVQKSGRMTLVK